MSTVETLTIVAIALAPFIAVFAQRAVEVWSEKRQRRIAVFKDLMATRGATLSYQHVRALNLIELEFSEKKKHKRIREAWRSYHDHLSSLGEDIKGDSPAMAVWLEKSSDFLGALLKEMAAHLNYDFESVLIKKGAYTPRGHSDAELEWRVARQLLLEVLLGNRPLKVASIPDGEDGEKVAERLRKALFSVLEGKKPVLIKTQEEEKK